MCWNSIGQYTAVFCDELHCIGCRHVFRLQHLVWPFSLLQCFTMNWFAWGISKSLHGIEKTHEIEALNVANWKTTILSFGFNFHCKTPLSYSLLDRIPGYWYFATVLSIVIATWWASSHKDFNSPAQVLEEVLWANDEPPPVRSKSGLSFLLSKMTCEIILHTRRLHTHSSN